MNSEQAIHSTYKSSVEVYVVEGGYRAHMRVDPNPEGGKVDWSKPIKLLDGPVRDRPDAAIASFLKELKVV